MKKFGTKAGQQQAQATNPNLYWDATLEVLSDTEVINHPNNTLYRREQTLRVCRSRLSTSMVSFLHRLYLESDDLAVRRALIRKDRELRQGYLEAYKEHSDRALMRLAERENLFDKWEGIYILGCYATKRAVPYLQDLLNTESDTLLRRAIKRAIQKIEINSRKKKEKRGF